MYATALALPRHHDDEPTLRDVRPWHRPVIDDEPTILRPVPPRRPHVPEPIESLSLPAGLREDTLPIGATPQTAEQARVWIVRVARDLARDYRVAYGVALRTDAIAVEKMQTHLASGLAGLGGRDGARDEKGRARELVRHGLVLGEIFARALGASWVDLGGDRPGRWSTFVPPGTTVCPVVRVQRFVHVGMREPDLVALFLELDAARRV
jgi:hypothetical protein